MAGYMKYEFESMQQLLRDMEADMIKVGHGQRWQASLNTSLSCASRSVTPVHGVQLIPCTKAMLPGTLGEALESQDVAYEQVST